MRGRLVKKIQRAIKRILDAIDEWAEYAAPPPGTDLY